MTLKITTNAPESDSTVAKKLEAWDTVFDIILKSTNHLERAILSFTDKSRSLKKCDYIICEKGE